MKESLRIFKTTTIIVIIVAFCVICCAATPIDDRVYKTILPDTPLYKETDCESEILIKIPQNAVVEHEGDIIYIDSVGWRKISYTSFVGYVHADALYPSVANDNYTATTVKAISKVMGEDIKLFDSHTQNSQAVKTVHDGEKLRLIENGIDYGEFSLVEYESEFYFVHTSDITDGLSYNQLLAVAISSGFVGLLIIAVIVIIVVRKKKKL